MATNAKFIPSNGRQFEEVAMETIEGKHFAEAGKAVPVLRIPAGAFITAIALATEAPLDAELSIGNAATPALYGKATAATAAGVAAVTVAPAAALVTGDGKVFLTPTAAATTGKAHLIVKYVVPGRANTVVPLHA